MKRNCLFVFLVFSLIASAQDEEFNTLIQDWDQVKFSGFGGPIITFTAINDDFSLMMGGGGGVIIGHFFVGGYGTGLTNQLKYKDDPDYILKFGHGGLWFGYTFMQNKAIHPVLSTQMGWGKITKAEEYPDGDLNNVSSERFMVFTPMLEMEMNFSHFLKLGVGLSCALLTGNGITDTPYTTMDFVKPAASISAKFGWF